MHPNNDNIWYVATGSGVWKTVNSGTTWTPIFDNEDSILRAAFHLTQVILMLFG